MDAAPSDGAVDAGHADEARCQHFSAPVPVLAAASLTAAMVEPRAIKVLASGAGGPHSSEGEALAWRATPELFDPCVEVVRELAGEQVEAVDVDEAVDGLC